MCGIAGYVYFDPSRKATADRLRNMTNAVAYRGPDGEFYNYLELREELEGLGHRFRTHSDTEVIQVAYEEWGLDCFAHLNGMWALAITDERRGRVVLSRDRLGEKPLQFAQTEGALVFASEMKSLVAFGVPRERDLQWAAASPVARRPQEGIRSAHCRLVSR